MTPIRKFRFGLRPFMIFVILAAVITCWGLLPVSIARQKLLFLEFVKTKNGRIIHWSDFANCPSPKLQLVEREISFFEKLFGLEFNADVAFLDFSSSNFDDQDLAKLRELLQRSRQELWFVNLADTNVSETSSADFWMQGNCVNLDDNDWCYTRDALNEPSRSRVKSLLRQKGNRDGTLQSNEVTQ